MTTTKDKGDALEAVVQMIETAIVRDSPSLSEAPMEIQPKKIMIVDGVRHEIDLFVQVVPAPGYSSTFIFECKNQIDPVSKNVVIVFEAKIKACQAQRGFFVARSFSKYAEAQAAMNSRILLLTATELELEVVPLPFHLHTLNYTVTTKSLSVDAPGALNPDTGNLSDDVDAELDGNSINLTEYLTNWSNDVARKAVNNYPSAHEESGTYTIETKDIRNYQAGQFKIKGVSVGKAQITIAVAIEIVVPTILSHFDIQTRGRCMVLAPVPMSDHMLQLALVAGLPSSAKPPN